MIEGKDILIRARTGSGKTAAFTIPLIQKILSNKQTRKQQEIKGLIIAPSKELCKQIQNEIIAKHLNDPHPEYMKYVTNVTKGIWYMDVSVNHDTLLYLTYDLTGLKC